MMMFFEKKSIVNKWGFRRFTLQLGLAKLALKD